MECHYWMVSFCFATIIYFITIEDTVSLWDCGEYITTAYKLEVGHPPGAPLFMVIGRLFSFLQILLRLLYGSIVFLVYLAH